MLLLLGRCELRCASAVYMMPRVMSLAEPLPVKQLMAAALQLEEAAGGWQVRVGTGADGSKATAAVMGGQSRDAYDLVVAPCRHLPLLESSELCHEHLQ
jgi:hypothetical protein